MRGDGKTGDEPARLRALRRLAILDTPPEAPFDKIVQLVRVALGVPICAVALIDQDRQWFKAQQGLAVCQTTRDMAFCHYTIQQDAPFIVRDALEDARFAANPLVTGAPFIRAYAGIPLRTPDGYHAGSLCIIDGVARDFTTREIAILGSFARLVENEIATRDTAATDALTGALSRKTWTDRAEAEIARAQQDHRPLTLAVLDIDHFRALNEAFGHDAGDGVIRHIAGICLAKMRRSDLFGCMGGKEFVLMMPDLPEDEAFSAAEQLRLSLGAPGRTMPCTVSIGLAALQASDTGLACLLARADAALDAAKKGGRNRTLAGGAGSFQNRNATPV